MKMFRTYLFLLYCYYKSFKNKVENRIVSRETGILLIDFIKWKIVDIVRKKRGLNNKIHLYGIRCIEGMYGQGKSTTMSFIGRDLRNKYGDKIYICSNYGFKLQDFPFNSITQIGIEYDKPIVFLWDEVQNEFPATDKVFPHEVRKALTLNRKGNGKSYYWCSQDSELVHKTIRRLTIETGLVRTLAHRYTRVKFYRQEDYLYMKDEINPNKKMKIKPIKVIKFIQTDDIRNLFNSYVYDNGEKLAV